MSSFLTLCPASENVAEVDDSISWVVVRDVRRPPLPERHLCNVLAHPGEGKEVEKSFNYDFWSDLSRFAQTVSIQIDFFMSDDECLCKCLRILQDSTNVFGAV